MLDVKDFDVIGELSRSKYMFHLTGSHYFGCADEESDIDFFVGIDEVMKDNLDVGTMGAMAEVINYLKTLGFKDVRDLGSMLTSMKFDTYGDNNSLAVLLYPGSNVVPPIHVQIVEDADLKIETQELLKVIGVSANYVFTCDDWNRAAQYIRAHRHPETE